MSTDPSTLPWLDLSGSFSPEPLQVPDMPAAVWNQPDLINHEFAIASREFFECGSVLPVSGVESGISALARLFQTWYGSMRIVLAEPCFDQWDIRFKRASHIVLDWSVNDILQGDLPDCDVVILGRPVNPTGELIPLDLAKDLALRLRGQGGWLILDEAYIDVLDEQSYCPFVEAAPAIVLRSLAPFSGLPGANLGFVCAAKRVCQALLDEVGTQAVSASQKWLALHYFEAGNWHFEQRLKVHRACDRLKYLLSRYFFTGIDIQKQGYFVTLSGPEVAESAGIFKKHAILVKVQDYGDQKIVRVGLPRSESAWRTLAQRLESSRP